MFLRTILLLFICTGACLCEDDGVVYDSYTGEPASDEQLKNYEDLKVTADCTVTVFPCDPDDWRRVDGTCNNLKYASRGTYFVPLRRILPAVFNNGNEVRKSECGKDLKEERTVRLKLLPSGKSVSNYTLFMPAYGIFSWFDIGSAHDTANLLSKTSFCCDPERYNDTACAPIFLREDDPVHRFDGLKCLNSTRPLYYQDFGCTKDTIPSPIAQATASFDFSQIYNLDNQGDDVLRAFEGGLLIVEEENGRIWPMNGPASGCPTNEKTDTRCFKYQKNGLVATNLLAIFYVRHHNYIANQLAAVNPSWDDDTLYHHAKDINTAFHLQVYLYDWMTSVIGHENLVKAGVIMDGDSPGFRDIYDENKYPVNTLEYIFANRWFHTMQETDGMMYDIEGNYIKNYPINNYTLRTGVLGVDQNMEHITQGCFRQPTSNHGMIDYDMAERGLGPLQRAMDIPTLDIKKNRWFGLPPYIDYVYHFIGVNITSFEDFVKYDVIPADKIPLLIDLYKHLRSIDFIAGMWVEKQISGGTVPTTLARVLENNMLSAQQSDRFWYERPNRPHAFTAEQLREIRKASLALLLCTVADSVTEIQPRAFKVISSENPLTPCSEIPQIDFSAWSARNHEDNKI